jgi:hypothetical protein
MPPTIAAIFVIDFKLMRAGCAFCPILRQAALAQSWAMRPSIMQARMASRQAKTVAILRA